jgi:uncharacterized protein (TIGR02270 family)
MTEDVAGSALSAPMDAGNGSAVSERSVPLRAGSSDAGFRIGLYLEHLEEASFLYDQRNALLDDAEIEWPDVDAFEERREAHLDALVLGGELALAVCRQQATEGDAGEFYAALCVACRHRRTDLLQVLLDPLDPADDERVAAAANALGDELPREWREGVRRLTASGHPGLQRIAARVIGYRRLPFGSDLVSALPGFDRLAHADAAWALGRLRDAAAIRPLSELFRDAPGPARAAAALALLRLGEWRVVPACLERGPVQPDALTIVGLGGGWAEFKALMELVAQRRAGTEGVIALGLFGCPLAVEPLLDALADDALAGAAADALQLITGAGLYGDVFVPEAVADDELFEDERAAAGSEGGTTAIAGSPQPGTMVTLLSRDPAVWRGWWTENATRFQPTVRYRDGQPHSPGGLLATLISGKSARRVRALAAEEMVVRYGIDVPFETELPVRVQRRALHEFARRAESMGGGYQPGGWHFGGQPLAE